MGRAKRPKASAGGGLRDSEPGSSRSEGKDLKGVPKVVAELIEMAQESGQLPWDRPWNISGAPRNALSNREYRGINLFYLGMVASQRGYNSNRWMTFAQAKKESYRQWLKEKGLEDSKEVRAQYHADPEGYRGVRKGETHSPLVFFDTVVRKEDGKEVLDANGNPEIRKIRGYHKVFNVDQTGLSFPEELALERSETEKIEAAEEIIAAYPGSPEISHGGDVAAYSPSEDRILMPRRERFHSDADYYHTLFHEMVHSTGHASRTNRTKGKWGGMRSESYAEEELVAEIGAAMLSAHAGLPPRQERSASYLQSWMKRLRQDPDLLLRAATKAQTAVDHILGTKFEEKKEDKK